MKKRNSILIMLLLIVVLMTSIFLASCKKEPAEKEHWINVLNTVEKPQDFADYELDIEWVTELKPDRPIVIIFNGYKEYDKKEKLALDRKAYIQEGKQILHENAKQKLNVELLKDEEDSISLTRFWEDEGFSVGIFHYERFADMVDSKGKVLDFSYKIFDRTKNEYKTKDGIKTASFNLLEAFVTAYNKHVIEPRISTKSLSTYLGGKRPFEVRFIGHKGGANFATAAADYLYNLNDSLPENEKIDRYLPNRLALLNPYWSNTLVTDVNIDYIKEKNEYDIPSRLTSLLTYNKLVIPNLSKKGVVFEVYQANSTHFKSYDEIYHGVEEKENGGQWTYNWKEGTDTNAYDLIKKTVAYMEFRESITKSFFGTETSGFYDRYDRVILDWYLYSVQGSDALNNSYKLPNGEWPTFDTPDYSSYNHTTSIKYGMSAWTSTVYLKVMQGHVYKMERYERGYGDTPSKYLPFTMQEFSSNIKQSSDFDLKDGGFFVAGYVYETFDDTDFVNLAQNGKIANAEVRLEISISDQSTKPEVFTTRTDENGFYKIHLGEKYLQTGTNNNSYDLRLSVYLGSVNAVTQYKQYINYNVKSNTPIYELIDIASINRPTNKSDDDKYRLGVSDEHKYFVIIKNCGLTRVEE